MFGKINHALLVMGKYHSNNPPTAVNYLVLDPQHQTDATPAQAKAQADNIVDGYKFRGTILLLRVTGGYDTEGSIEVIERAYVQPTKSSLPWEPVEK